MEIFHQHRLPFFSSKKECRMLSASPLKSAEHIVTLLRASSFDWYNLNPSKKLKSAWCSYCTAKCKSNAPIENLLQKTTDIRICNFMAKPVKVGWSVGPSFKRWNAQTELYLDDNAQFFNPRQFIVSGIASPVIYIWFRGRL